MSQSEATIGVCLHDLAAREAAVIRRVMAFSASQGRRYEECELPHASLLVVSDDTRVLLDALNPQGCMIVRIADRESSEPRDVMLERPLLVTRVLRSLDEARALLLQAVPAPDTSAAPDVAADSGPGPIPDPPAAGQVETPPPLPAMGVLPNPAAVRVDTPPPLLPAGQLAETPPPPLPSSPAGLSVAPVPDITGMPPPLPPEPVSVVPASPVVTPPSVTTHLALVVDDSAAIRKQLELELRQAGIAAEFAEDGEQALERVQAGRHDLIFLDIVMPGLDGYEVCRRLRQREGLKKIPIIMLSAKTSPLDEVQGVIAGATTYLTKPVRSEQLQKTLQRV
ncbi:MAG: response regulator, partial [Thiothrix sp.]|nr:response regulator [Thiothrix sp.]